MITPKVYIDTCVLKDSASQLPRLRPRRQKVNWGGQIHEITVHDSVRVNPNDAIKNPDLKSEAELLPLLAEAGKTGTVKYVIQVETLFESWRIPNMDSETGRFYGALCELADAPMKYGRILNVSGLDAKVMQFRFLSSIKDKRFLELQRIVGAHQGPGKLNQRQLLDAFHLWCAEHNACDYFLTLDFKLIRVVREQKRRVLSEVVKPSELLNRIST